MPLSSDFSYNLIFSLGQGGEGEVKHSVPSLPLTVLAHVKPHLWLSGSQYVEEQQLALQFAVCPRACINQLDTTSVCFINSHFTQPTGVKKWYQSVGLA